MRIFVTGATGFIGSRVVKELIAGGHKVQGLARSDDGAKALAAAGADVQRGTLEDIEILRSSTAAADAVIHCGFNHDFSNFMQNCQTDKQAIEAMGSALAGSNRTFIVVSSGLAGLAQPGQLATEESALPPDFPFPRVSEPMALSFVSKGVRVAVMRLPQVHNTVKQGLFTYAIAAAREKGVSAYVGEGTNRWAAAHVDDVAHLYRLALEKPEAGARWHAVAEEGVHFKDVAETIGRGLNVKMVSVMPEEAPAHFGWWGRLAGGDLAGSSAITRQKLGWNPTGPSLLTDLQQMDYSQHG
jgi:nucleoside-diphosphate-sugar epimerase